MNHQREQLIARLAERDTKEATQQDLEVCFYQSTCEFYRALSDPALARLADACGEPINLQEEHDHDQQ